VKTVAFLRRSCYDDFTTQIRIMLPCRECVFCLLVKTHSPLDIPCVESRICVVANGAARFSVCGSIWGHTLFCLIGEKRNMDFVNIAFIGILILVAVLLTWNNVVKPIQERVQDKKQMDAIHAITGRASFDVKTKILTLYSRDKTVSDAIKMRPYTIDHYRTKPKEYIYTGVTVGGITTGSVSEVGGYRYIAGSQKTEKCIVTFFDSGIISRIQLTDELFQQAKNSKIAKYLDEDKKQIVVYGTYTPSQSLNHLKSSGDINLYTTQREIEASAAIPEYKKCIAIKDWVAGIDSSADTQYKCPTCGYPITFGATKCNSCGQDIVWQ